MTSGLSRWIRHRANGRIIRTVRRGTGSLMGMDVLVLTTVGRRSGKPRETPVAWFADGPDAWLIVASGGGDRHPDWYANLLAHPERATVELAGRGAVPVIPERLSGAGRARAWERIAAANPRMRKHQSRSDREYPVLRLTPR